MTPAKRADHAMLASATVLTLLAQATLLTTGFIASFQGNGTLAHVMERYAFGLILMPAGAIFIQEIARHTYGLPEGSLETPHAGWIALATLATLGAFATYCLAIGTTVAFQTQHVGWGTILAGTTIATVATTAFSGAKTVAKALENDKHGTPREKRYRAANGSQQY